MTHIKSRADQNGKPQTYETQIDVMQKNVRNWTLWSEHRSASKQWPTWRHTSSGSRAEIPKSHGQQRWWCPFHNHVRESRENVGSHGGWTRHSQAVPNSTVTQNDERNRNNRHKHPDQKSIGLAIKTFFTRQKIWRPHRDHAKQTW